MNLGQRIQGALAALSGSLSADLATNTSADADFRTQTEATLAALGTMTTDLKTQIDAITEQVANGETVDPAVFADIKAKVDSLDAAFPDAEVSPPEDDDEEDTSGVGVVEEGSEDDED